LAIYKILDDTHEVLKAKSEPVTNINAGVLRVLDNMKDTLYAFDGVGLAAPQIGISRRIIVVDIGDNLLELINPQIISSSGECSGREGCLSLPGIVAMVNRPANVTVKALNRNGEEIEIEADDLLARALQHEIDHLDGILITDRATSIRREKP